jgi:hypothetical protein
MYRFHTVDSSSITSFNISYRALGIDMAISARRAIGLQSLSVRSTITLWFEHAHHILLSQVITDAEDHLDRDLPSSVSLLQNYPNPFNPSTIIAFDIPEARFISLKVYDVLGREVETLVNEEMKPGSYQKTFKRSGLPSGVYFYQLRAGEFLETKKMLVVR